MAYLRVDHCTQLQALIRENKN